MRFREIRSCEDMHSLILDVGFLPLFKNHIEGFSIEECTPRELWFSDEVEGPWEWKGPCIQMGDVVYGKFMGNKACFIRKDIFTEFANYRRNGYDFDALYDDGMAPLKDKKVFDIIYDHGTIMTKELKEIGNYKKGGNKGFETIITRLQMQTYVCVANFERMRNKKGEEYGWGIARYTTPEYLFGDDLMVEAYKHEPEESKEIVREYLRKLLPDASYNQIIRVSGQ